MTYLSILNNASAHNGLAQPIQRTLIVMLGKMAAKLDEYLDPALGGPDALSSAIARLDIDATAADPGAAIREKLAGISRAGAQTRLAKNGYVIDRLRELLLFLVVDLNRSGRSHPGGRDRSLSFHHRPDGMGAGHLGNHRRAGRGLERKNDRGGSALPCERTA